MSDSRIELKDETDTDRLGELLAEHLPDGTMVALSGTLGAGKTRLTQALAVACGIEAYHVTSPTFVLCQHYVGRRRLNHLDAYRIKDDDEFLELGVDEMFDSAAITLVEWADRVPRCLPDERLELEILVTGNESRTVELRPFGESLTQAVQQITAQW